MPLKNRKSIFFDKDNIRDLVFKGYIVIYIVKKEEDSVEVFGFTKDEQSPF